VSTTHCDHCLQPVSVGDLGKYDEKTGIYIGECCLELCDHDEDPLTCDECHGPFGVGNS
jgi:hypothetical protein